MSLGLPTQCIFRFRPQDRDWPRLREHVLHPLLSLTLLRCVATHHFSLSLHKTCILYISSPCGTSVSLHHQGDSQGHLVQSSCGKIWGGEHANYRKFSRRSRSLRVRFPVRLRGSSQGRGEAYTRVFASMTQHQICNFRPPVWLI